MPSVDTQLSPPTTCWVSSITIVIGEVRVVESTALQNAQFLRSGSVGCSFELQIRNILYLWDGGITWRGKSNLLQKLKQD